MTGKKEATRHATRDPLKSINRKIVKKNCISKKNGFDTEDIENLRHPHHNISKEMSFKKPVEEDAEMLFIPTRNHEKPYNRRIKLRETTVRAFKFTRSDKNLNNCTTQNKIPPVDESVDQKNSAPDIVPTKRTNSLLLNESKSNKTPAVKKQTESNSSRKSKVIKLSSNEVQVSQPSPYEPQDKMRLRTRGSRLSDKSPVDCRTNSLISPHENYKSTPGIQRSKRKEKAVRELNSPATSRENCHLSVEKSVEKNVELDLLSTHKPDVVNFLSPGEKTCQQLVPETDLLNKLTDQKPSDCNHGAGLSSPVINQDSSKILLWARSKNVSSSAEILDLDIALHCINRRIEITRQHQLIQDDRILSEFQTKLNEKFESEINDVLEDESSQGKYQVANRYDELMERIQKMDYDNEKLEWQLAKKKKALAEEQEKRRKIEEINSFLYQWSELKKKLKKK